MFDISWTEFLLIGVVALIVIGPKELPGVLRTVGQWTRKVRIMATDFQHQFNEAMREAEMADLKKQVDDMAHDFKNLDPLKDVRNDVEFAGRDIERSLSAQPVQNKAEPAAEVASAEVAALGEPPAQIEAAAPATTIERSDLLPAGAPAIESAGSEAPPPVATGRVE